MSLKKMSLGVQAAINMNENDSGNGLITQELSDIQDELNALRSKITELSGLKIAVDMSLDWYENDSFSAEELNNRNAKLLKRVSKDLEEIIYLLDKN